MSVTSPADEGRATAKAAASEEPARLGITCAGAPDAPAIVLLHGTRLTRAVWTHQVEALSDEFRVLAIDLPGHGERGGDPFDLEAAAEVVADVIRADTADGRAVVVGLSLGGYVGMALAGRHPELVRGLVIAGASAEPIGIYALPYRALANAFLWLMRPRPERWNAWFFRRRYPATLAEPIVAGGFWPVGGADALRALVGRRFAPLLAAYPGPILIVNGQYDLPFRFTARRFAGAARRVRRVRLAGAAHLSNLDRPVAFTQAVRAFARSAGRS